MDEILAQVLRMALPLVLAALAEVISERGGVVNLGIEGIMLAGALAAALVGASGVPAALPLALVAAAGVGLLLASVQALFVVVRGADQIVTGTALHFCCLGATTALHEGFGTSKVVRTFAEYGRLVGALPYLGTLALVLGTAFLLQRSSWGLRLRAVGEDPVALEAAGGSAIRSRSLAVLLSGALCGLAGASLTCVLSGQFVPEMTQGRGFLALGLVLFARWSPLGALWAGLFLGAAFTVELQWSVRAVESRGAAMGAGLVFLVRALPYLLTVAALAVWGRGTRRPPAALGRPLPSASSEP